MLCVLLPSFSRTLQFVFLLFIFVDGDNRPRVLAHPHFHQSHPGNFLLESKFRGWHFLPNKSYKFDNFLFRWLPDYCGTPTSASEALGGTQSTTPSSSTRDQGAPGEAAAAGSRPGTGQT